MPCDAPRLPNPLGGEPAKAFVFDEARGLVVSSKSDGKGGIPVVDAKTRKTAVLKAPEGMPTWDHYPPPGFAYDPVSKSIFGTHPKLEWRLMIHDPAANAFRWSKAEFPGKPDIKVCGGLVYDSLNRELILVGGKGQRGDVPTLLYDRKADAWVDLEVRDRGKLRGGDGLTAFDPEHNVFLGLGGGAWRHKPVPTGTKAYIGERP